MNNRNVKIPSHYLEKILDTAAPFQIHEIYTKEYLEHKIKKKYIEFNDWAHIILTILELIPDSNFSYRFGLVCKATTHGALGFAMLTNTCIENVLFDIKKYYPIGIHKFHINFYRENNKLNIIFTPIYQLPSELSNKNKKTINDFLAEIFIVDLVSNLELITDYKLTGLALPACFKNRLFSLKKMDVEFTNLEENKISFDYKFVNYPLKLSSKSSYLIAKTLLEDEVTNYYKELKKDRSIISLIKAIALFS